MKPLDVNRAGTEACPYEWLLESLIGIRSNRRIAADQSAIAGGRGGPPLRGGFVTRSQFGDYPMVIQTSKAVLRMAVGKSVAMSRKTLPREGVAALPYAEILNPLGEHFAEAAVRADAAVRPYAEDLYRLASFEIHPGTKKRRMLCIVVSRLPAVSQRLMLLDYQIGLDFASGTGSGCADRITIRAIHPIRTGHLHD